MKIVFHTAKLSTFDYAKSLLWVTS